MRIWTSRSSFVGENFAGGGAPEAAHNGEPCVRRQVHRHIPLSGRYLDAASVYKRRCQSAFNFDGVKRPRLAAFAAGVPR